MNRPRAIHPLLFAFFPAVSLLSLHAGEVAFREAAWPIGILAGLYAALWLLLRPVLRDAHKRALAISLFWIFFFAYGPVINNVRGLLGHHDAFGGISLWFPALVALVAVALAISAIRGLRYDLATLTRILNRVAAATLAVAALTLLLHWVRYERSAPAPGEKSPHVASENIPKDRPNIFFIILDAYARADILQELYHYDNSGFLDYLRGKGFYVAGQSYSNYLFTYLSVSATLNLDYLNALAERDDAKTSFGDRVLRQLRSSRAAEFLRGMGYTFVTFSSGYAYTEYMDADVLKRPDAVLTEYQNALINMTPVRTLLNRLENPWQYLVRRNLTLYAFDQLPKLTEHGSPLFVFAHIVAPHPPFVLGEHGEAVYPRRPYLFTDGVAFMKSGITPEEYIDGYRKQLSFVNTRMKQIIDAILAASPNSIIIIQADHGSKLQFTDDLSTTNLKEAFAILNACYLPNRDASKILYPTVSPVNTFRLIFDAYFDAALEHPYGRLDDRSYFCHGMTSYNLTDVTGKRP